MSNLDSILQIKVEKKAYYLKSKQGIKATISAMSCTEKN